MLMRPDDVQLIVLQLIVVFLVDCTSTYTYMAILGIYRNGFSCKIFKVKPYMSEAKETVSLARAPDRRSLHMLPL